MDDVEEFKLVMLTYIILQEAVKEKANSLKISSKNEATNLKTDVVNTNAF